MTEYVVTFEIHKNQKIIYHKHYRLEKKKFEMMKKYLKNTISGISKKHYPKYNAK